jgi:phosphopantetheinyl transferase
MHASPTTQTENRHGARKPDDDRDLFRHSGSERGPEAKRACMGWSAGRSSAEAQVDAIEVVAIRLDVEVEAVRRMEVMLSNAEHQRASCIVHDRDRRRFIVGRARLRELLATRLGAWPESIECRENEAYLALHLRDRPLGFFNCWTRKEAFIKALGDGLYHPLDRFDVSLTPGEPARILRVESTPGDEREWRMGLR